MCTLCKVCNARQLKSIGVAVQKTIPRRFSEAKA